MAAQVNASRRIEIDINNVDSIFDNIVSVTLEGISIDTGYTFEIKDSLGVITNVGQSVTIRDNELIISIPKGLRESINYEYTIISNSTDYDKKYFQFGEIRVV